MLLKKSAEKQLINKLFSMEYTIEEKVTATAFAIAFENAEESRRRFVEKYNKEAPLRRTVLYRKAKLLETGNLIQDRPKSGRPVSASGNDKKRKFYSV